LCARTAVYGAYFNVRINAKDIKDRTFADDILNRAKTVFDNTIALENEIIEYINETI